MEDQQAGWHDVVGGRVRSLPNGGQGDCLFRALSHQLEGAILAPALRQRAVAYMTENIIDFAPQLLGLGWDMLESGEIPEGVYEDAVLPHVVLDVLRLQWTWGGAESIAALSRSLRRRVIVYQEGEGSIHFTPNNDGEEDGPALRLLHRMTQGGRRTHYESVLQWQPASGSSAPVNPPAAISPPAANAVEAVPEPAKAPVRRSTRLLQVSPSGFREENFSDEEELIGEDQTRRYTCCKLCPERRHHRGRYALLNCGLFPVCGSCVRHWFVQNPNLCPHCGTQVHGWVKVYNQN